MSKEINTNVEQDNENSPLSYTEQTNQEFEQAIQDQETTNSEIEDKSEQTEESFFDEIFKSDDNPEKLGKLSEKTIKWIKKTIILLFGGSWLSDMFGIKDKLNEKKEAVLEALKNPVNILKGVLGGFAGFTVLKGIANFASPSKAGFKLAKGLFAVGKFGAKGLLLGGMAYGAYALFDHFTSNPEDAKTMPQEKGALREWWKKKIEETGVKAELEKNGINGEEHKLIALLMGEKTPGQMFNDYKEERKEKNERVEYDEKYGKMITVEKKIEQIKDTILPVCERFIKEIDDYIKTYPELIVIGGLILNDLFDLKGLVAGGAKITAETLFKLGKLPITAARHPYAAIFTITGLLYGLKELGDVMVPESEEGFKLFLKDSLESSEDSLNENLQKVREEKNRLSLEGISFLPEQIDIAAAYFYTKDKAKELFVDVKEEIEKLLKSFFEQLALTDKELVENKNIIGLEKFYREIDIDSSYDKENYLQILELINNLVTRYKTTRVVDKELLKTIITQSTLYNIEIVKDNGYYTFSKTDDEGNIIRGPVNFMIDPDLSPEEQLKKAETFYFEDSFSDAAGAIPKKMLDDSRRLLQQYKDRIDSGEYGFMVLDTGVYLLKGAEEKVFLGPWNVVSEIAEQTYDWDFNKTELAIAWGNGILPVTILTTGSHILSASLSKNKNFSMGKVLYKSVMYPFDGAMKIVKGTKYIVFPALKGELPTSKENLRRFAGIQSHELRQFARSAITIKQNILSTLKGTKVGDINRIKLESNRALLDLNEALNLLYESEYKITGNKQLSYRKDALERLNKYRTDIEEKDLLDSEKFKELVSKTREEITIQKNKIKSAKYDYETKRLDDAKKLIEKSKNSSITKKEKNKLLKEAKKNLQQADVRGETILALDLESPTTINELDRNIQLAEPDLKKEVSAEFEQERQAKKKKSENGTKEKNNSDFERFDNSKFEEKTKHIQDLDIELIEKTDKLVKDKRTIIENWAAKSKRKDKTLKTLLENLEEDQLPQLKELYQKRADFTLRIKSQHPDIDLEKHGLHLDEDIVKKLNLHIEDKSIIKKGALDDAIKNKHVNISGSRLKTLGKITLGTAVVLGISYLGGKLLEENTESGNLAAAFESEKAKKKDEKEIDIDEAIYFAKEFEVIKENYRKDSKEFFETINNKEKLEKMSKDQIISLVERAADEHLIMSANIMRIITVKNQLFNKAFEIDTTLQEKGLPIVEALIKLKYDKEKKLAYLQYASKEEFKQLAYDVIDDRSLAWEIGGNFIPFYGSYRDLYRASNQFYRGNTQRALQDLAWGGGGAILDAFTLGEGSSIVKGVIKGGSVLSKTGAKLFGKEAIEQLLKTIGKEGTEEALKMGGKEGVQSVSKFARGRQIIQNSEKQLRIANTIGDATEQAYPGIKAFESWAEGNSEVNTYSQRYYAFSPENAQDIPFDKPGVIRMSNRKIETNNLEEFSRDVEQRMERYIGGCFWKNAKYEIIDINNIKIQRTTSDNEIIISRDKDGIWNLEGEIAADGGYTFEQAFAMANLSNKTAEWLNREGFDGDGENPFHVDGDDIEFDIDYSWKDINIEWGISGNRVGQDIVYLAGDGAWLEFYDSSFDIPKDWIVNLLNRTYKKVK